MTGRLLLAPSPRVTAGLAFGLAAASGLLAVESPLLAVAFSALVLGTLLVVAHPDFATLVVAGLLYSNAAVVAVRFHGIPSFATNFIPLLLVVPIAYHVLVRKQPLMFTSAFPFIVAFGIVQGLSTIDAREPAAAGLALETFLFEGIALYFIVTNAIRSFDTLRRIVWVLLAVGATLGALSILQTATGTYRNDYFGFAQTGDPERLEETLEKQRRAAPGETVQPRLAGPIGEKNRYAQILLVLLPLGLFRYRSERSRPLKLLAGGLTAVTAIGAALALSRGAALALVLLLLIMAARRYVTLRQLAVLVAGFVLIATFIPAYQARVESLVGLSAGLEEGGQNAPDGAIRGRAGEMAAAALVFVDHPVLGVGPGNFPFYYPDYAERIGLLVHAGYREAHSLYLDILAETGAVGLLCFLAAVIATLRDLNRARRRWRFTNREIANTVVAFELAVVAQLATGLFLQHSYIRYFWFAMALAGAAAWLALRESAPSAAGPAAPAQPVLPRHRRAAV
jgi:putative inorganic carbon (hco3(-)) transporter